MNTRNAIRSPWNALMLGLVLVALSRGQTVPLAKQRVVTVGGKQYMLTSKLKSILVGSFYYNYNHNIGTPMLDSTLKRIGRAEGWTVDITHAGGDITTAKLANYEVFFANYISSWASATTFPTVGRTAVQDFVENKGGGVFIMHASGDSRASSNWPWYYNTAHPVTYTGESSRTDVKATVGIPAAAKTHPVMEGIGFGTNGTSDSVVFTQGEWHTFTRTITTPVPNAEIFLSMNGATCHKGTSTAGNCGLSYNYSVPGGYPATWAFPDQKGYIGYFMEGHDEVTRTSMGQANWDRFFKQFMYYIAGYDSVLIPTGIRGEEQGFALDASGVSFHPNNAGVFISAPGVHTVALYDLSGRKLREIRGRKTPVDYDLSPDLKGVKRGVYVVKVSVGRKVMSRRFIL